MRVLLYEWNSYLQYDVKWVCKEKGISVTSFSWVFKNKNEDEKFVYWFNESFSGGLFDALFSINYWPMLSEVAQKIGIRYIAWCYDNPLNVKRIEETIGNPVNTVIMFDRIQAEKYISRGYESVVYHPLCINTTRYKNMTLSGDEKHFFSAEVSFVGTLYESKFQEIMGVLDSYSRGFVDAAIEIQQDMYGCYLFDKIISDSFVNNINENIIIEYPESHFTLNKEALSFAMASEVTRRERIILLSLLGRRFDTKLYSHSKSDFIKDVDSRRAVDYVTEMPKVFASSKINLNPILKCIQSGIPLRALDIMGAGGFLLSSYQIELGEYFTHEYDMVMYESIEDAIEKAKFYIEHDDIRRKICVNGTRKVHDNFSLQTFFNEIIRLCE